MNDNIDYSSIFERLRLFANGLKKLYDNVFTPLGEWYVRNQPIITKFINGLEGAKISFNAAEKLGDNQFVFSKYIDIDFAKNLLDSNSINEYMSDYFSETNDRIEWCRTHNNIKPFSVLFSQITASYEKEQYNLVMVGLVSLIDGVISQVSGDVGTSMRKKLDKITEKITFDLILSEEDICYMIFAITMDKSYKIFTSHSDFDKPEPTNIINRHWIAHGRTTRTYTQIDCIKLINLLYGILLLEDISKK